MSVISTKDDLIDIVAETAMYLQNYYGDNAIDCILNALYESTDKDATEIISKVEPMLLEMRDAAYTLAKYMDKTEIIVENIVYK